MSDNDSNSLAMLDLSMNNMGGVIPSCLGNLSYISVVDLRMNNLIGRIPPIYLEADSFDGNSGLCGFPLSKKCGNDVGSESPPSTVAEDHESETTLFWKITTVDYGCGLVFGFSMGYIVLTTGRPHWLVKVIKRNPQKRTRSMIHRNRGEEISNADVGNRINNDMNTIL
ncbi:hypothetical protein V6N11_083087 [Hibiscus sabdariffa]|uniref:Uncharacterized protein n=1 Tax=Hibiscus sabdariffa TaxID=183260 RepID=A0ABR2QKT4_9ROSI